MGKETEQWLLDGDCTKCRRKKYCRKQCTKRKRYVDRMTKVFVGLKIGSMAVMEYIRKHS